MPTLSWNEIRQRAIAFSREWADETREQAEAQSFWNEFFDVFGVRRRAVAVFEEPVKSIKESYNWIDLFWRGTLLAEHKSAGESLDKAQSQAFSYIQDLATEDRHDEIPRYVIVCDFQKLALYDLEPDDQLDLPLSRGHRISCFEFKVTDLHKYIQHFAFIPGYKVQKFNEEDPANIKAANLMADLHDSLESGGYTGSDLERLLVRLLFCLFAEDTGIIEPALFQSYLNNHTRVDGSDLGLHLARLFEVLDTPITERQKNLDEDLADFPYVNGELFAERLHFADFTRDMRDRLLATTRFDWSRISPAIFGSLFQGVLEPKERRQIGAHYTTERNILKVIRPLFLDQLRNEFQKAKKTSKAELKRFHNKLASLKFFDPACGCGNFLVIAYRELRLLELELLKDLMFGELQHEFALPDDVNKLTLLDVDQFYGIEIEEWPCRIAETALWLTDHQMNILLSESFGQLYKRLPLRKSPKILHENALRVDWNKFISTANCSYVFGNPPYVGKKARDSLQQEDMDIIFRKEKGTGVLDYVTCWYAKAGEYIHNSNIRCAFVSTNSISQGEQPGILWPILYLRFGLKIHFAHRTFPWESEAKGKAHVHVVIIGFGNIDIKEKLIFEYEKNAKEPLTLRVANINPYLVEGNDLVIYNRSKPINEVSEMTFGNMPNDDGNLILNREEKERILAKAPKIGQFIRPLICAKEYLRGIERWCIWLKDVPPSEYRSINEIRERINAVRVYRLNSNRNATKELVKVSYLFGEIRQPDSDFILLPRHSSERRTYIPFMYFTPDNIVHDSCLFISDASLFDFGLLSSAMHMAWMRQVCGRLKSDFRYSAKLVYNNFPRPNEAKDLQKDRVSKEVQIVIEIRNKYFESGSTLDDLYDPLYMPPDLLKAHQNLDRATDRCYRSQPFTNERQRIQFLFQLYEKQTAPILPVTKQKRRRRSLKKP